MAMMDSGKTLVNPCGKHGNRFALLSLEPDDVDDVQEDTIKHSSVLALKDKPQIISNIGSKVRTDRSAKSIEHTISVDDILTDDGQVADQTDANDHPAASTCEASDQTSSTVADTQVVEEIPHIPVSETSVTEEKEAKALSLTDVRKTYSTLIKEHRDLFTKQLMNQLWDSWKSVTPEFPGTYNTKLAQIRGFVTNPDQKELILHDRASKHRFEYHQICSILKLEHKSIIEGQDDMGDDEGDAGADRWHVVGKGGRHEAVHVNAPMPAPVHAPVQGSAPGNQRFDRSSGYSRFRPKVMGKDQGYEHFNNKHKMHKPEKQEVLKTLILTKPDNWCWEFTTVSSEQKQIDELKLKERVQKHREWVKVMKTKRCAKCTISAVESELFIAKSLKGLYCERCVTLEEFTGHDFKHAYGRPF